MIRGNSTVFGDIKTSLGLFISTRKNKAELYETRNIGITSRLRHPVVKTGIPNIPYRVRSGNQCNKLALRSYRRQIGFHPCLRFKFSSISHGEIVYYITFCICKLVEGVCFSRHVRTLLSFRKVIG